jgi:hypothetical protein
VRKLIAVVVLLLLPACRGGRPATTSPAPEPESLVVKVASYDLAVGEQRFIAGLLTQENQFVSHGETTLEFAFIGTADREVAPDFSLREEAKFLPIPGEPEEARGGPVVGPASQGRGVYSTVVDFDRAGFWRVRARAEVEGQELIGTGAFEVLEDHAVPAPGDLALKTKTLTLDSDAPRAAIDSRAENGEIPDPELHDSTIAQAIAARRPVVAVFSTPLFCVSKFCGPVTDMVLELSRNYSDRAEFIHVEIWRDFEGKVVNKSAAEWVVNGEDLQEPWVFLIGEDGRILERWDNVATRGEIEPELQKLAAG